MTVCELAVLGVLHGVLSQPVADRVCNYSGVISEVARKTRTPAELLICIGKKETKWRPELIGSSGECGVTQVLPRTNTCKKLQDVGFALEYTSNLISSGYPYKVAKSFCNGDAKCVSHYVLAVYNAGKYGVSSKNKRRWKRGQSYATEIKACTKRLKGISSQIENRG